jgi:hypothetical protein
VDSVRGGCEAAGCEVLVQEQRFGPVRIELKGEETALILAAEAAHLPFIPELSRQLAAALEPLDLAYKTAERSEPPINWARLSFDFETLEWSDEVLTKTAHEYKSRYGATRYYVDAPDRGMVALERRTAVYAAAMLNSVDLAEYHVSSEQLATPLGAPLPAPYARAASLCSGRSSAVHDGRIIY